MPEERNAEENKTAALLTYAMSLIENSGLCSLTQINNVI